MKFIPDFPIANLTPAPYNPRKIDEEAFAALVESIRTHGVIRPVIATDKLTILAGHQRTKAMLAAGVTHTPVFMAEGEVSTIEELRFNQFHNAIDVEDHRAPVSVPPGTGWEVVDPAEVTGTGLVRRNQHKTTMAKLLLAHGSWSNAIATESGRVLVGSLYAAVATTIGYPLLVRYVPDETADAVLKSFGREYGEFSYDHIKLDQWNQASNQPSRHPGKELGANGGKPKADTHLQSSLYVLDIIPRLAGHEAILDFGSGRGAYAQALRERGHEVIDVEFYRRKRGSFDIDHVAVQKAVDQFCAFLAAGRRFDVVVLDSVLNSVGRPEAQTHCLTLVNALCKPGGLIGFTGKSKDAYDHATRDGRSESAFTTDDVNRIRFFDKSGVTAIYNKGAWYFQKYHTLAEVQALAETYIGPHYTLLNAGRKRDPAFAPFHGTHESFRSNEMWQCAGFKERTVSEEALIAAVQYEFELPYRSGRTVGRSADVLDALRQGGFIK